MCSLNQKFVKHLGVYTRHAYKSDRDDEIDIALKYIIFILLHVKLFTELSEKFI